MESTSEKSGPVAVARRGVGTPRITPDGLRRLLWRQREMVLFATASLLLVAGVAGWMVAADALATWLWTAATALGLIYSSVSLAEAVRHRRPSVDLIT